MMSVKDKNVKDGSLLSTSGTGVILSITPYDAQIAGVVARDAGIIISSNEGPNAVPVISNGTVYKKQYLTENLYSGIYFIRIENSTYSITEKLIKKQIDIGMNKIKGLIAKRSFSYHKLIAF